MRMTKVWHETRAQANILQGGPADGTRYIKHMGHRNISSVMGLELLAPPLALSIAVWGFVAILLHSMGSLVVSLASLKRYTAKQILVTTVVGTVTSLCTGGRVVSRMALWVFRWWLFFLLLFFVFSVLHVTYNEFPEAWIGAARVYNRFMGPYVQQTVLVPLRIVDLLLRAILPLWNSTVWFLKTLGVQGLLPILIDQALTLVQLVTAMVGLVQHLALELVRFFESFSCQGLTCLHPEQGVLDLLTSMADVREIAVYGVQVVRAFCSTLAAPLDLLVYPLLDLNLAEGVHNLVNAALQLLVVIPRATVVRCVEKEANQFGVLMCTPDLAPFFNFLAAATSSVGLAIDNWANVALLIVETVVGGDPPQCSSSDNAMIPDLVASDAVFKAGATVVVGLTDWLYSVTDGVTAVYMGHNDGTQAKVQRWPFSVDTGLGVAAVTYSGVHDLDVSSFSNGKTAGSMQTTAMMGCNCTDTSDVGMRVVCAVLPISGIPTGAALDDYRFEILFSDVRASGLYTCAGVDLYVKPVRWSHTRYETRTATLGTTGAQTTLPTHDCISRGTCRWNSFFSSARVSLESDVCRAGSWTPPSG